MANMIMRQNELEPRTTDVWGLQSDINRLFDAFLTPVDGTYFYGNVSPRLDIAETKDKYEIKAELPGIDEKDIKRSNDAIHQNDFPDRTRSVKFSHHGARARLPEIERTLSASRRLPCGTLRFSCHDGKGTRHRPGDPGNALSDVRGSDF